MCIRDRYRVEPVNSQTIKIRNKIIYKGRIRDFKPIQTLEKKVFIPKDFFHKISMDTMKLEMESKKSSTQVPKLTELLEEELVESGDEGSAENEDKESEEWAESGDEVSEEEEEKPAIEKILYPQNDSLLDWKEVKELDQEPPHTHSDKDHRKKPLESSSMSYAAYKILKSSAV